VYVYGSLLVKTCGFAFDWGVSVKPIRELLPEIRASKGWSRDRLSHQAFAIDQEGTSGALIAGIERGTRRASPRTIAALATALDVEPTVFAEYRLALARHIFDEEKVGLDQAVETLESIDLEPIQVSLEEIKEHSHQRRRTVDRAQELAQETVQRVQPKPQNQ
jgi:transcriptional regulator with XRE-family HTH domain